MPYKDASPLNPKPSIKNLKQHLRKVLFILFMGFIGSLSATLVLQARPDIRYNTIVLMWTITAVYATLIIGLFAIARALSAGPERKKSPRPVILAYRNKVIVFRVNPPEKERMTQIEEADFWAKTVYIENQLRQIVNEHPNVDLTKYEKPLGMKIISVDSAHKPDDSMPIGEPY